METTDYLDSIERDAATIVEIGMSVPLDTPIPSCPDWTLDDLIEHTGIVHRHKTATVRDRWVDEGPPRPERPTGGDDEVSVDLIAWFGEGVDEMVRTFRTSDLSEPTWTWCDHDHTAAWWVRRMAHETAIHAADAVLAAGGIPSLDADLATDGVDEILDEMIIGGPDWGRVVVDDGVVALEASDRRWVLRFARFLGTSPTSGTDYDLPTLLHADSDATVDATVRTDPSHLDLWLWGRSELPDGSISGDLDLVAKVRSLAADATQ